MVAEMLLTAEKAFLLLGGRNSEINGFEKFNFYHSRYAGFATIDLKRKFDANN
jgi:hypothetical protein